MRPRILLAVLALIAGAAIAACGKSVPTDPSTTTPVTFVPTVPVPTTTIPTPTSRSYMGPEQVPIQTGPFLAPATTTHLATIVDGIQCQLLRQLAYRAYLHLQVYVRGQSRALPGGIGLVDPSASVTGKGLVFSAQTCYYWIHTRAADGVVQVESPIPRRFTLGDFFAVWDQPLGHRRVAGARGKVTAEVNGKLWHGNPRLIPLTEHADIELAVGKPVPRSSPVDWLGTAF